MNKKLETEKKTNRKREKVDIEKTNQKTEERRKIERGGSEDQKER